MKFLKKNILIILIFILAVFLRFYRLDIYPALNADEAAIGYNAYSLIKTGLDEHGNPWPVHFQSFNDYKPGLFFYIVLPFVKVLGLNIWSVRLPGAALGVFTVLAVYFLVKSLFESRKLSLASAFLLAISPWHIQFSRGGWEVNASTFFITSGLLFFVKGLRNSRYWIISTILFVASLFTYHAARIVVPLLGLSVLLMYRHEVLKNLKGLVLPFLIGFILLVPLLLDFTKGAVASRAAGVGLFADPGPLNRINEQRGEHADFSSLGTKIAHNKAVNYGLAFFENWLSHFHGEFLFLSGDSIQRNKVPETGGLYLFEILTLFVGLISVIKNWNKGWKFIILWLAVAPTAAALTFQSPHSLRAENMVIPLEIISALGLVKIFELFAGFKNNRLAVVFKILFGALIVWNFARYLHIYYLHMAKEYPFSSQYGVSELVSYVMENKDKYQNIVVTDKYDQPYILFLFYSKFDPAAFQKDHQLSARDEFGFSTVRSFGNYRFINFGKWDDVRSEFPNSLIVGAPDEVPKEANIIKRVYGTNGFEYFDAVAN
jgi:4-amino-4-deoxy-L-arabinose transferase-like glycosyltransferase